ncbi:MAG: hypothetical protein ACR2QC_11000 [Gammaproteobacteria bacterium]
MVFFIFSDTVEFGIVRKEKKHRHSGESRNLFARKRKRIRLAANEIPAFAGMGRCGARMGRVAGMG